MGIGWRSSQAQPQPGADVRWWREPGDPHSVVAAALQRMRTHQTDRGRLLERYRRLYGDLPQHGRGALLYQQTDANAAANGRLTLNVVKSVCNTARSDLVQSRPRPQFLTSGGDWSLQQRAKKLTKFVDGLFYTAGVDRIASRVGLDAIVYGDGAAKIYEAGGKIRVERVYPGELYVDERDGIDGEPRSLYQIKTLDRYVLAERFPDQEEEILTAARGRDEFNTGGTSDVTSDMLTVVEAWHLPSGPEADDGRHVICLQDATLLDEAWEDDSFPFAFLRWCDPLRGFWGTGVVEEIRGLQKEINRLLQSIQEAHYLGSQFKVFVPKSCKLTKSHLSNANGAVWEYDGPTAPHVEAAQVVHPEIYAQVENLVKKAYEIPGVSQLQAQAQKPAGLDSGESLRVYDDIGSKRFVDFGHAYEEFHLSIARLAIRLVRRLAADDPSYDVVFKDPKKRLVERIKWSEVDLDEESYELQTYPVSSLPKSPAGRMAAVNDMFSAQWIDGTEARRLLDFPDLDEANDLAQAPRDLVENLIDQILDAGTPVAVEPFFPHQLALSVGVPAYLLAKRQAVPEERLEMLRQYMEDSQAALQSAQAPAAPPPGPPPQAPPMPQANAA